MSRHNKKQRREAKRKAKRQETRRRDSVGPLKRLIASPGELECWRSDDFEEFRQMQLFAYKRGGGTSVMAAFLVDRGIAGLKDTWLQVGIERDEFEDLIDRCMDAGFKMRRTTVEEVRRYVAGAMRWAHEYGMRLPKDWSKPASLIGGVGDWMNADVSEFIREFGGHPEDLRQRLIGEPLETFVKRKDIVFKFSELAPYMDQRSGEYLGGPDDDDELSDEEATALLNNLPPEELQRILAGLAPAAANLAAQTVSWLNSRGQPASEELLDAWMSLMLAQALSVAAMPDADQDERADFAEELVAGMADRIEESRAAQYDLALAQVLEHFQTDLSMIRRAVEQFGVAGEDK